MQNESLLVSDIRRDRMKVFTRTAIYRKAGFIHDFLSNWLLFPAAGARFLHSSGTVRMTICVGRPFDLDR